MSLVRTDDTKYRFSIPTAGGLYYFENNRTERNGGSNEQRGSWEGSLMASHSERRTQDAGL